MTMERKAEYSVHTCLSSTDQNLKGFSQLGNVKCLPILELGHNRAMFVFREGQKHNRSAEGKATALTVYSLSMATAS